MNRHISKPALFKQVSRDFVSAFSQLSGGSRFVLKGCNGARDPVNRLAGLRRSLLLVNPDLQPCFNYSF